LNFRRRVFLSCPRIIPASELSMETVDAKYTAKHVARFSNDAAGGALMTE
jgi:hypothetical protein